MIVEADGPFDFKKTYNYMKQQDDCLYNVVDETVRKAAVINGYKVLFEVTGAPCGANVEVLVNEGADESDIQNYVRDWFDLAYDLNDFYAHVENDDRLSPHLNTLYGFRMLAYVDIADAFMWAVLGQQINMKFAYVLKRRVIEHFNRHVLYEDVKYYLMPSAEELAALPTETFRDMQISTRKAEYLKGVMAEIDKGPLSKKSLLKFDSYDEVLKFMTSHRGIGPWSANTVLMRSLKYRNAVPVGDAGLKNVFIKTDSIEKPSTAYVEKEMRRYGRHSMYATVYLWETLKE